MKVATAAGDDRKTAKKTQLSTSMSWLSGNRSAAKNIRRIELGWMCDGKVLRTSSGGETRKINVSKDAAGLA